MKNTLVHVAKYMTLLLSIGLFGSGYIAMTANTQIVNPATGLAYPMCASPVGLPKD